jgi:hypothetical protein
VSPRKRTAPTKTPKTAKKPPKKRAAPKRRRRTGPRVDKKTAFLAALRLTGNVSAAADAAGVDRKMHYLWLQEDPAYPKAADDAIEEATDTLEHEARRRAIEGTRKPVYQGGKLVGYIIEYSDTLLTFLLSGRRSKVFGRKTEITGKNGGPIDVRNLDWSKLTEAQLRRITAGDDLADVLADQSGG